MPKSKPDQNSVKSQDSAVPTEAMRKRLNKPPKLARLLRWAYIFGLVLILGLSGLLLTNAFLKNRENRAAQEYSNLLITVADLNAQQKYDEAEAKIEDYLQKSLSKDRRYGAEVALANTYSNEGNSEAALEWYQKAYELNPDGSHTVAASIAKLSEVKGDKDTALKFYQKALELFQKAGDASLGHFDAQYQNAIDRLEGKNSISEEG
ncbi:tetratricopeptide repeat protein [Candidatus Microgenomates bacterium]|nr:tetratricopeptide repeat protein [Candidatus Microgenomates bacterium]